MTLTLGSLCSGIGGLELGVERAVGARTVWQAEIDPAASKVLAEHWPGVPNIGDVRDLTAMTPVDILTAGYPCQPFSSAGRRKGTDDPRHLWPAVRDAIAHLGPRLVVLENVRGHLSLGFDQVLGDLAGIGYDAEWCVVRASDVGCCHQRARLFVAAYPHGTRLEGRTQGRGGGGERPAGPGRVADAADASHVGRERDGRARGGGAGPANSRGQAAADAASERGAHGQVSDYPEPVSAVTGPGDRDSAGCPAEGVRELGRSVSQWGPYAVAVRRHEAWHGPAPDPTTDGRLSAAFVEWMMGYPQGWTDAAGSRNNRLRCLGNAVVPQVAEAFCLGLLKEAAAA